ncbi:hypothetical protein SAMN02799630_05520 [Paenibacillus sp. UNCCL117]|uniref:hypothetical protein n=1 Tax=unclassified Paenibacillus TaxID=185978 RepID=UPI00088C42B3|nr:MULTISPECIES: hypothetical protein [unclassified Paenibacillus]SDE68816.1 hypothetical protein SAMN04488602_1433 [Paenibacillus sp. cl123]SFW66497.1 hypothetical protein SAMN02799630_05520 [Paenibacillus sp. UNCCL117]
MSMEIVHEMEPMPMPPSVCPEPAQEQVKAPKLTMKLLYELIGELQEENRALASRLEQFEACQQFRLEVAAAVQWSTIPLEPQQLATAVTADVMPPSIDDSDEDYMLPRSKRHMAPKKKTAFWSHWFSRG